MSALEATARKTPGLPAPATAGMTEWTGESFPVEVALAQAAELDANWRKGRTAGALAQGAHVAAAIVMQLYDPMVLADPMGAQALALCALARAVRPGGAPPAEAMLAEAMGYAGAARKRAAGLPSTDPMRAFILRDDHRIASLAVGATSVQARHLHLARLVELGKRKAEREHYLRLPDPLRLSLSVQAVRLPLTGVGHDPTAPARLGGAVIGTIALGALQDLSRTDKVLKNLGALARAAPDAVATKLGLLPAPLVRALDAVLAVDRARAPPSLFEADLVGDVVRSYLGASLYQAAVTTIWQLGSIDAAKKLIDETSGASGAYMQEVNKWLELWTDLRFKRRSVREVARDFAQFNHLRGAPMFMLMTGISQGARPGSLDVRTAGHLLAIRYDDRIPHRVAYGGLLFGNLYDPAAAERLYVSISKAAGGRDAAVDAWIASRRGDAQTLRKILESPATRPFTRLDMVKRYGKSLGESKKQLRKRAEDAARAGFDRWNVRRAFINYLEDNGDRSMAIEAAQSWVDVYPKAPGLDTLEARALLAKLLQRSGRLKEALAALQPAVGSQFGGTMYRRALVLAGSGRHDEAMAQAMARVKRYPQSDANVALIASLHWRRGHLDKAAKLLARPPVVPVLKTWRDTIGVEFMDVYGDGNNVPARECIKRLTQARISPLGLQGMAFAIDKAGNKDLAADLLGRIRMGGLGQMRFGVHGYRLLVEDRGEALALEWLEKQIPLTSRVLGSMMFWDQQEHALQWSMIRSPPPEGPLGDSVWLYRAAAVGRGYKPGKAALEALADHFDDTGDTIYHLLGRYLMGHEELQDVLQEAKAPDSATEVAYWVGVKAEADGRLEDALVWYLAAIDQNQTREGEYGWAINDILRLRDSERFLADGLRAERKAEAPPP